MLMVVAGQIGYGDTLAEIAERIHANRVDTLTASRIVGVELDSESECAVQARGLVACLNSAMTVLDRQSATAGELFRWMGKFPTGISAWVITMSLKHRAESVLSHLLRHNLVYVSGDNRRIMLPGAIRRFAATRADEIPTWREAAHWRRTVSTMAMSYLLYHFRKKEGRRIVRSGITQAMADIENIDVLIGQPRFTKMKSKYHNELCDILEHWVHYGIKILSTKSILNQLEIWSPPLLAVVKGEAHVKLRKLLGDMLRDVKRHADSAECIKPLLPIYREMGDRDAESDTLMSLGDLMGLQGKLEEGEKYYEEGIAMLREIGNLRPVSAALRAYGHMLSLIPRVEKSEKCFLEAIEILRQLGGRFGEGETLVSLAEVYEKFGRHKKAVDCYQSAVAIFHELEDRLEEGKALQSLGIARTNSGDPAAGFNDNLAASKIFHSLNDFKNKTVSLVYFSRAARAAGDLDKAIFYSGTCLAECIQNDNFDIRVFCLAELLYCFKLQGEQMGVFAATLLAFDAESRIGLPLAKIKEEFLRKLIDNFDPDNLDFDTMVWAGTHVHNLLIAARERIIASGEELFGQLKIKKKTKPPSFEDRF